MAAPDPSGKTAGIAVGVVLIVFVLVMVLVVALGNIHYHMMFPAPQPSYTLSTAPTIHMINGVPTLWNAVARPRGFLLYLHANGVDIGMIRGQMHALSRDTQLTVLAAEYPGYGISPGPPSPLGAVSAARRVYEYIQENKRPGDLVVVMGRSIGTGVAGQLVRKIVSTGSTDPPTHLVLLSAFASIEHVGKRMAGDLGKTVCKNVFHTLKAVRTIPTPTLLIVGSQDTVTPPEDSRKIHAESVSSRKQLEILENNSHSALDWPKIYGLVKQFTTI